MDKLYSQLLNDTQIIRERFIRMVLVSLLGFLFYLGLKNFELYHSIVETMNIVFGLSITVVAVNTHNKSNRYQLLFLGIIYLFISIVYFTHLTTHLQIGFLSDLSLQLLIAILYIESTTFLVQGIILGREKNTLKLVIIYLIFLSLSLLIIAEFYIFSKTYLSLNFTTFKTMSFYIISGIYITSLYFLYRKKNYLDCKVFNLIKYSIIFKIIATVTFEPTIGSYEVTRITSNILRLVSFYLIYNAVVKLSLKNSYKVIENKNQILEAILNSTTEAILVTNKQREVIHCNNEFIDLWGMPKEIIESGNDRILVQFAKDKLIDPDAFVIDLERISKDLKPNSDVLYFKDGRIIERHYKSFVQDSENKGILWTFRDITDREKFIEELKIKDQIIKESANGIAYVDKEWNIKYVNDSFLKMWGYDNENEILNKNVSYFTKYSKKYIDQRAKAIKEQDKWTGEFIGIRKDGSEFEIEIHGNIIKGKQKEHLFNAASFIDISERKSAQRQLAKNKELYIKLIELLPGAIFVHTGNSLKLANNRALKLVGATSLSEIEKIEYETLIKVHPDYKDKASERINKILKGEEITGFAEQKLILNNGEIIDVEIGNVTFSYEENLYIITVVRDITERINLQRLEEDNIRKELQLQQSKEYDEMKTQFFSNVSHDLKTPLNILLGGLQILKQAHNGYENCPNYNKFNKYSGMMKQNCYRLLRLINNLIDITKAETQLLKMSLTNVNIINLVESMVESITEYAEYKGIHLTFDTDVEEKIMAVDPDMIERIMLNLLSNSLKFTGPGGNIEVTITSIAEGIELSIKDTGLGIPKEKLDEVFERYKQVNSLLHKENEGTGLGLALVKTFVEAHNGRIRISSEVGRGSEFIISLPSKIVDKYLNLDDEIATTRDVNIERINIEFSDIYS